VSKDSKPTRKPAEIESDIVDTRERLVGTIGEIQDRVSPANVADRGKDKVKAFYVDDNGVRWQNVAITAGAVVGTVVALRLVSTTVRWVVAAPPPQQIPTDVVFLPVPREQAGALAALAATVA
jgi:hypothetical protein